ncbi:unnamed protein product [Calypogeia fissa]
MRILIIFTLWALAMGAKAQSNPWVAYHGMTSDQYQNNFNNLVAQGYRLNYVSGYTLNNDPRFAAIFEQRSSPSWVAHHGMTSAQYQQYFNTYISQGYRLVVVNGYTVNGMDYYVAIWDQSPSGAWVARHEMTSSDYQSYFNTYVSQGYRLRHVSGYAIGTVAYYAAIWEKTNDGIAWVARHGMTSSDYQNYFNTYVAQGYRLIVVSGYQVNNVDYYAALWDKSPSGAWVARHGMTSSDYQSYFNTYVGQGYMLKVVSGYDQGQSDRYAALWGK